MPSSIQSGRRIHSWPATPSCIHGGEQGREEEPGVEDAGAVPLRPEQRRPVVGGGRAGVLLGVRGPGAGAVRGARRPRQPPALPPPPRRRRAGVRLRGAGPPRAALLRRRLPRRALAHGPRRPGRGRRRRGHRRPVDAHMRPAARRQREHQGTAGGVPGAQPAQVHAAVLLLLAGGGWRQEVSSRRAAG
ncbi:hypothetical protein D1007_13035 [Hordeum vulgare]|nr:hypothetical protein D1007_13035 [Hordeum vulgare]